MEENDKDRQRSHTEILTWFRTAPHGYCFCCFMNTSVDLEAFATTEKVQEELNNKGWSTFDLLQICHLSCSLFGGSFAFSCKKVHILFKDIALLWMRITHNCCRRKVNGQCCFYTQRLGIFYSPSHEGIPPHHTSVHTSILLLSRLKNAKMISAISVSVATDMPIESTTNAARMSRIRSGWADVRFSCCSSLHVSSGQCRRFQFSSIPDSSRFVILKT